MRSWQAPARAVHALLMGIICTRCAQAPSEAPLAQGAAPVVYGVDDRIELGEAPEAMQALFLGALVALVPATRIRVLASGNVRVEAEPLGLTQGLCAGVRFSDEPSAATCSGTLVTDNLVLTARHCVTSLEQCQLLRWVFGYAYATTGELNPLGPDDLYGCQRIVAAGFDRDQNLDFAWVELDRPVRGRRPLPALAGSSPLAPDSRLMAAGFGQGLPAKFDPNVEVLASFENYFTATVDAFTGSSGMPVVNADGALVGFTLRGEDDYETVGGCNVPQLLGPKCAGCAFGGEQVAYLGAALDALEAVRAGDVGVIVDAGLAGPATTTDTGVASEASVLVDAATLVDAKQGLGGTQATCEPRSLGSQAVSGPSCSIAQVQGMNRDDSGWWLCCWGFMAWVVRRRRNCRRTTSGTSRSDWFSLQTTMARSCSLLNSSIILRWDIPVANATDGVRRSLSREGARPKPTNV